MNVLLASVAISGVGAVLSLCFGKNHTAAKGVACVFGILASVAGLVAGFGAMAGAKQVFVYSTQLSFAPFSLMSDGLSGLMLLIINGLALAAWVYGLSYFDEYREFGVGKLGFFTHVFIAAMCLVVTVDNAFWFLVFFELMSLSSYFLVIVDGTPEARRGGLMYLIVAHIGFLLIAVSYFLLAAQTGSLDFQSFRAQSFNPGIASAAFILAFVGFGCKAGMVPLHSWLPHAHPAAPSNISALMSGAMIKIGIFGMMRMCFDFLAASGCAAWWGMVVLVVGGITAVLGVAWALAEDDIKRLLAYSSVENIGVILIAFGVSIVGAASGMEVVALLGFVAALFHMLNHAAIKGLLFMGAGSVLHATKTRNMQLLGGLHRAMPLVSVCFLIGALAISAIPPLNGFASEWIAYQALFSGASAGNAIIAAAMAFGAVCLALTGALAVACFVKAYGVTFLGMKRSDEVSYAQNVPGPMAFAIALLAAACVALGVCAPWVIPCLNGVAATFGGFSGACLSMGAIAVNPLTADGVSAPLLAFVLVGVIAAVIALRNIKGTGGVAADRDSWACGYVPTAEMPPDSASFAAQANVFMRPMFKVRTAILGVAAAFERALSVDAALQAGGASAEIKQHNPFEALVSWLGASAGKVEGGNFRVYILYIIVAFIVLFALMALAQMGGGLQ